jgi:hypothetical protein
MKTRNSKVEELTQFDNAFLFGVSNDENLNLFQRFIREEEQKTGKFPEKLSGIFLASNNTDSNNNLDATSKNRGHFISVIAVLGSNNQYRFVINNPLGSDVEEDHKEQFATNISKQLNVEYQPDDIIDVSWQIQGKGQNINSLGCGPLAIADSATISNRINNEDDIDYFQSTTAQEDDARENRATSFYNKIQKQRQLTRKVLENKDIGNLTDIINQLKALKNQISLNPNDKDAIIRAKALIGNLSDPSLLTALEDIKQDIEVNKNKISRDIENEFLSLNRQNNLNSLPSFGLGMILITGPFAGLTGITEIIGSLDPEMLNWAAELRNSAGEVFDWLSENTDLFGEISTELNLLRESTVLKDGSFALDYIIPPTELVTSVGAIYGISLVADTYEAKERNAKQIKEKLLAKETATKEQLKQKSQDSYNDLSTQVVNNNIINRTDEEKKKGRSNNIANGNDIGKILEDFGLRRDDAVVGKLSINQQDMGEAMRLIFKDNKEMHKYRLDPIGIDDDVFNLVEYRRNEHTFKDKVENQPIGNDLASAKKRLTDRIKQSLKSRAISVEDCEDEFESNGNRYKVRYTPIRDKIAEMQDNSIDRIYANRIVFDILNKPQIHFINRTRANYKDKTDFSDADKEIFTDPILGERKITHFTVHEGGSINGGHYISYQLGKDNNWYKLPNDKTGNTELCKDNPLQDLEIRQNICSYVTLPYNDYQRDLPEEKDLLEYKTPNHSNFCFLLAMINQINFLPDKDREAILKGNNEFLQMSQYIEKTHGKPLFYINETNNRLFTNNLDQDRTETKSKADKNSQQSSRGSSSNGSHSRKSDSDSSKGSEDGDENIQNNSVESSSEHSSDFESDTDEKTQPIKNSSKPKLSDPKKQQEADAKRKAEAEALKKQQEDAKRKAEAAEALKKKQEAEAEAKIKAEALKKQQEADADAKRKAEAEAAEAALKKKQEAEAEVAEAKRKADAEVAEALRKQQEAEAKIKADTAVNLQPNQVEINKVLEVLKRESVSEKQVGVNHNNKEQEVSDVKIDHLNDLDIISKARSYAGYRINEAETLLRKASNIPKSNEKSITEGLNTKQNVSLSLNIKNIVEYMNSERIGIDDIKSEDLKDKIKENINKQIKDGVESFFTFHDGSKSNKICQQDQSEAFRLIFGNYPFFSKAKYAMKVGCYTIEYMVIDEKGEYADDKMYTFTLSDGKLYHSSDNKPPESVINEVFKVIEEANGGIIKKITNNYLIESELDLFYSRNDKDINEGKIDKFKEKPQIAFLNRTVNYRKNEDPVPGFEEAMNKKNVFTDPYLGRRKLTHFSTHSGSLKYGHYTSYQLCNIDGKEQWVQIDNSTRGKIIACDDLKELALLSSKVTGFVSLPLDKYNINKLPKLQELKPMYNNGNHCFLMANMNMINYLPPEEKKCYSWQMERLCQEVNSKTKLTDQYIFDSSTCRIGVVEVSQHNQHSATKGGARGH